MTSHNLFAEVPKTLDILHTECDLIFNPTLTHQGHAMETVGIRELKQNLSKYIKMTKQGKQITITDRKKAVAVLSPFVSEESEIDRVKILARTGIVEWKGHKPTGSDNRPKIKGKSVSEAVLEDRR